MRLSVSNFHGFCQKLSSSGFLWRTLCFGIWVYGILHFTVIYRTAVNIPYLDEMELFANDGIILGWSKDFIFSFFMDHRIILTKVAYLLNYDLFRLDFRYQIILIALFHIALAGAVWIAIVRRIGDGKSILALLAFLPMISTLPMESHSRAIAIGKHLTLLALLGGTYLLFCRKSWMSYALGVLLLAIAFLGSSSGIGGVAAVSMAFVIWNLTTQEKREWLKSAFIALGVICGLLATFQGFQKVSIHPAFTYPWDLRFLRFMAENISLGFGYTDLNPFLSFLCLYIVLSALIVSIWHIFNDRKKDPQAGFLIAFTLGVLGMVAAVTFGSGGFSLWNAKMSRYAEVSIFFPLLSVALFQNNRRTARLGPLWVLFLLAIGLVDNFGFSGYQAVARSRNEGARCVQDLLRHPQDNPSGICPTLYPYSIRERMETAKKLGVGFTRN